jgi:hypothetical protein
MLLLALKNKQAFEPLVQGIFKGQCHARKWLVAQFFHGFTL